MTERDLVQRNHRQFDRLPPDDPVGELPAVPGVQSAAYVTGLPMGMTGGHLRGLYADFLDQVPRAGTNHPATLEMYDDIGLYEKLEPRGIIAPRFQYWDRQNSSSGMKRWPSGSATKRGSSPGN